MLGLLKKNLAMVYFLLEVHECFLVFSLFFLCHRPTISQIRSRLT